jgi:hypothetical protein
LIFSPAFLNHHRKHLSWVSHFGSPISSLASVFLIFLQSDISRDEIFLLTRQSSVLWIICPFEIYLFFWRSIIGVLSEMNFFVTGITEWHCSSSWQFHRFLNIYQGWTRQPELTGVDGNFSLVWNFVDFLQNLYGPLRFLLAFVIRFNFMPKRGRKSVIVEFVFLKYESPSSYCLSILCLVMLLLLWSHWWRNYRPLFNECPFPHFSYLPFPHDPRALWSQFISLYWSVWVICDCF